MPSLTLIPEGIRLFSSSWKQRFAPKQYAGNAQEICQQIVNDCWNGQFFQTSTSNFCQFWTRDFGFCTAALLKLGYQQEVRQTLKYALHRFYGAGKITTAITPQGKPFDFPRMAVDSLPWLIHSLRLTKFPIYQYTDFLNQQILKFVEHVVNPYTGLVQGDQHFSSMKDYALRQSSCYDNCMLAMLTRDLREMKELSNLLRKYDYHSLLRQHFWNGKYFYDDLAKQNYVAGDANVFPFLLDIINDEEMLHSALREIQQAGLDAPFPLKYTASRKKVKFIWEELFVRNYEGNTIWTHLGPLYIKIVQQIDKEKAEQYKQKYTEWIEREGNYREVFRENGKPFRTPFYSADQGMLWAANYLVL
ncbi:MAG: hypothetical protein AABX13_00840 [Nanoarchaeota archaeon]